MKIGIIREGKNPPDKRVPFTPKQCKEIIATYPQVELFVQKSPVRAFEDKLYSELGIPVVEDLTDCDVIFGVKEVNIQDLIPNKTYFFFSHTIKKQPYNRKLLQAVIQKNIRLVDYECLTNSKHIRLVGFGKYAGIVGTYNAFLAYGKRTGNYTLKPANLCFDRNEMEAELVKIKLPKNYKVIITGMGRVAKGSLEILNKIGLKKVSPADFLKQDFEEPVFTQLSVENYFKRTDGKRFTRREIFENPLGYVSDFFKYAAVGDMYIPCHFWDSRGEFIMTKEELKRKEFKLRTIADISCDIDGPIPSTIRPSTISDPIYQYHIDNEEEVTEISERTITVMAVDNLPCELPKDASRDFGKELINKVLPCLLTEDETKVIERASIAVNGELGPNFQYLEDYLKGN